MRNAFALVLGATAAALLTESPVTPVAEAPLAVRRSPSWEPRVDPARPQDPESAPPPPPAGSGSGAAVQWFLDYEDALAEQRRTGKPILVYVRQDNCPPCDKISRLHRDQAVADAMNDLFVPVFSDVTGGKNPWRARSTPTYIVVAKGRERVRRSAGSISQSVSGHVALLKQLGEAYRE